MSTEPTADPLDRCYDLRVHRSDSTSSVVLEYASEGEVVATGYPCSNNYVSVIILRDRKVSLGATTLIRCASSLQ